MGADGSELCLIARREPADPGAAMEAILRALGADVVPSVARQLAPMRDDVDELLEALEAAIPEEFSDGSDGSSPKGCWTLGSPIHRYLGTNVPASNVIDYWQPGICLDIALPYSPTSKRFAEVAWERIPPDVRANACCTIGGLWFGEHEVWEPSPKGVEPTVSRAFCRLAFSIQGEPADLDGFLRRYKELAPIQELVMRLAPILGPLEWEYLTVRRHFGPAFPEPPAIEGVDEA
jgi:hypothetical protein